MRAFLAALAMRVRAGEIEIHCYCLMSTHYHLLLRSPQGRLSQAMHRVQLAYSRYFNRGRGRDGPLVRGRFLSKPVDSLVYRIALISYIDRNPVQAGMAADPAHYPHGSAFHYSRSRAPRWLTTRWVSRLLATCAGTTTDQPARYRQIFGREELAPLRQVVQQRIGRSWSVDPLDDLVQAAPAKILDWLRQRANLADGTRPGQPVADAATVEAVLSQAACHGGGSLPGALDQDPWRILRVALIRQLCSLTQQAIADRIGCSITQINALLQRHRKRISSDTEYGRQATEHAVDVLAVWDRVKKGTGFTSSGACGGTRLPRGGGLVDRGHR